MTNKVKRNQGDTRGKEAQLVLPLLQPPTEAMNEEQHRACCSSAAVCRYWEVKNSELLSSNLRGGEVGRVEQEYEGGGDG